MIFHAHFYKLNLSVKNGRICNINIDGPAFIVAEMATIIIIFRSLCLQRKPSGRPSSHYDRCHDDALPINRMTIISLASLWPWNVGCSLNGMILIIPFFCWQGFLFGFYFAMEEFFFVRRDAKSPQRYRYSTVLQWEWCSRCRLWTIYLKANCINCL